ncbi:sulfatase-like hydrolase/transferase [Rufibacter ruber]|uniref:sulfatase-like hydrolase/transferase n=1 Tax=Rufibacter ruber TaxID=1783499 RepID=UPI00082BC256|nr:sulfatase-like hydrolase/transferase [Rufibacter ruber]
MNRLRKPSLLLSLLLMLSVAVQAQQRPNIILILADDLGFSDIGSYGGEVKTPNLDKLAAGGIKYKQFYNAARCCPTRASLMTGLYPHQAGMGWMAAADLGTPAYQGNLNQQSVTIAEVLKQAGYGTYMTGKWHLTNERKINGGVVDNWPKQRGFDQYFGIVPGGSNYFTPQIYSNNQRYPAPKDFYLTTAISDTSVKYIDQHFSSAKKKDPLFMYVAYTAPHWPLHALQKDIDKYKDFYKVGWDKLRQERFEKQKKLGLLPQNAVLSPRDKEVKAWETLPEEKKNEMAMRMAIYAAQIDVMDQGIGRIVAKLKEKNQLDNTLIFFLSDNGACAEFISSGKSKEVNGQEDTFESYRLEWANLSSTPFREYKHYTHEGGIATPLLAHWPKGIDPKLQNSFVKEYGHVSDIMATCVELAKTSYPKTFKGHKITPLEGKSLVPHFTGKTNNRGVVYWEHEANLAVRDGKWKLVAKTPQGEEFSTNSLELYDLDADPSEMNNLANQYPDRVTSMYQGWFSWANQIGAFPLDTREYNVRMEHYRRKLNSTFEEDLLGGWRVNQNKAVSATLEIDPTGQLTGKNAVKVAMQKPGERPNQLAMVWNVKLDKGQQYQVKLNAKAKGNASFLLRFEQPNGEEKLLDQTVSAAGQAAKTASKPFTIPQSGNYQLALYFGQLKAGDELWVDDIELVPIASNK